MIPGSPVLIEPGWLIAIVSVAMFAVVWWRCSPRWHVRLIVGVIVLAVLAVIAYFGLYG